MSVDVLASLEALLGGIDGALEGRKLGSSIERAADRLSQAPRQAERFEAFSTAAQALGGRQGDREAAAVLGEALEAAAGLADAMAEAGTGAQLAELEAYLAEFKEANNALEASVRARWRRVIEAEFLPLTAVARVLSRIPASARLAADLSRFGEEARGALDHRAGADAIVAEIVRLRGTRDRLDAELHSLTGDPEIDAFLLAVTANAATLAIASPAVLSWLAVHGALEAFSIGARGV